MPPPEWVDGVAAALDRPDAATAAAAFAARAPAGYAEQTPPGQAARDLAELESLCAGWDDPDNRPPSQEGRPSWRLFGGEHRMTVLPAGAGMPGPIRLRRYGDRDAELTGLLPVIESFGLVVIEAVPYRFAAGGGAPALHVDDLGLRVAGGDAGPFDPGEDGPRLVQALRAVASGDFDVDPLNRLVTVAGLHWRQVMVLRAYRRYRRQNGTERMGERQLDGPLVAFPEVTRKLVAYFEARFDPRRPARQSAAADLRDDILAHLADVPALDQDAVLRGFLGLIDATVRTSYFAPGLPLGRRPTLVLKFDSRAVPGLAEPRPLTETFVHGASVEGVHLRWGAVARGGVRWSDRPEDLRTEVLGLARAQVKKNAIIVPTGAKGGFVCRGPDGDGTDGRAAYEAFVRGLLGITDNVAGGRVVTPPGLVVRDGEDPYLVVAADRGTATFSDLANAISAEHRFWLGDAFASGGSHGYDHKAMGITARGAWVAATRHFHELGVEVDTEPVSVVGVGDMSGDVFGNGLLQSRTIRLVGAFDHRHVMIDPDPDPGRSFDERLRLASLPHSSWDDYDRSVLSAGGGVWSRRDKAVPLSPEARAALALGSDAPALSAPEVVTAILAAPADLLWLGGIGTFVRHPEESDADVCDPANDAVRITADQLRARVVVEGANLGATQRARVRYSRRGGRINTDFIDNAAGVATSDREVNLKILLALAVEEGALTAERRDAVLARVKDTVADEVLSQVARSVAALSRAVPASATELDAYEALLSLLERGGQVSPTAEALPDRAEIAVRRAAGAGLIRPELAVLLAYAKSDLVTRLAESDLVHRATIGEVVREYFPVDITRRFGRLIPRHRLYPQLAATGLAGELVDRMGIVWTHEIGAQLGRPVVDVAAAFWAARQVLAAGDVWADIDRCDGRVSADEGDMLHGAVTAAVSELARSYLVGPEPLEPGARIAMDRPLAEAVDRARTGGGPSGPTDAATGSAPGIAHPSDDLGPTLGERVAALGPLARIGDAGTVARASGRPVSEVVDTFDALDTCCGLDRLATGIRSRPAPDRLADWEGRALLDDLARWRSRVATSLLDRPGTGATDTDAAAADPVVTVQRWAAARRPALDRVAELLAAAEAGAEWRTAAFLALRALPDGN